MGRKCKKNVVGISKDDLNLAMSIHKRDLSFLYPFALGVISFLIVVGLDPLNPINTSWILGRLDPTQHYLGWLFYRDSEWAFPVGLNPNFGQDLSSSIVYSDSIPLLAIPFKALGPLLPERFQYFGIWLCICFILQAWVSWKILGLYSKSVITKLLGCGLFIFIPPMLWRINTPAGGHAALVAHFLILWAIYLILRPSQSKRALLWLLLLSMAVLTHFYLFVIVTLLWLADLANHYFIQSDLSGTTTAKEFFSIIFCIALLSWQAGYFVISTSLNNDRGYGFYGMNILGLIDPQGWSHILRSQTNSSSWGEGFSFFGLGILLASVFAFIALFIKRSDNIKSLKQFFKHYQVLSVLIIFLTIFSISNRIGIGDLSYTYPLPAWALVIADSLRSSARMFWPIHYLLAIAIFVAIVRTYSHKSALAILSICFLIQVADTSKGWLQNRQHLALQQPFDSYTQKLSNIFWVNAPAHYRHLTLIPAVNRPPNWENFAIYAIDHHLTTNAVHMARIDLTKQDESNKRLNQVIDTGTFDVDTLYVVENQFVIAALASASETTAIAKIDTFNVIAPKWNNCNSCPPIDPKLILARDRYASKLGEVISFTNTSPNRSYYLRSGWSWPEDWGTWSETNLATLNFSWPKSATKTLTLNFKAFVVDGKHPNQDIDIKVNGIFYQKMVIKDANDHQLTILLTPEMKNARYLSIEFKLNNPARPIDLIPNQPDQRTLGIGIKSAVFY